MTHTPECDRLVLPVARISQPDDVSCGPTCLAQVYASFGDPQSIDAIAATLRRSDDGGTLAVHLAQSALAAGYEVALYPLGVRVFDPTWRTLGRAALAEKLRQRAAQVPADRVEEHLAYAEVLDAGGRVELHELEPSFLVRILDRKHPIICGLSATWLYRHPRERPSDMVDDDVGGEPTGHFVVLSGYTGGGAHFHVRDPSPHAPFGGDGAYVVSAGRLITAILLGDATRDAVLLEIWPDPANARPTQ